MNVLGTFVSKDKIKFFLVKIDQGTYEIRYSLADIENSHLANKCASKQQAETIFSQIILHNQLFD